MKNSELIAALSKLNPDAEVLINVKQANKVYGVVQLPILQGADSFTWVDSSYAGATITVHLPGDAYIAKLPKT